MPDLNQFALWLKRRRKSLDLTRAELAQQAHCSPSALRRLESADLRASKELALALATALGLTPTEHEAFIKFARGEISQWVAGPHDETVSQTDLERTLPTLNLPAPLTSFVGRKRDLAGVCSLLRDPAVRLLTLTGPPGTGKTRLSLAATQQLLSTSRATPFPDGAYFVALAPISDASLVASAIAQTLGVREPTNVTSETQPFQQALKNFLRSKRLLLVLDNFEQVLTAAPLISDLLLAAPGLKVLVTSRALLNTYGEHEFPVAPLTLPDIKRLPPTLTHSFYTQYSALLLFSDRARAVKPDFQLGPGNAADVAQICAGLDGLPLAIEMAAAQVKWLPIHKLNEQLSNRLAALADGPHHLNPRQQTLRGAIDWSYDLLDNAEQQCFRRLAVFVGGFTAEAAEYVAQKAEPDSPFRLSSLHSLVSKNLLLYQAERFSMLYTIREYGLEKLSQSETLTHGRDAHLQFFVEMAEQADSQLHGPAQLQWLDWFELEHDNLRAALDWAIVSGRVIAGLRLGGALGWFWRVRGYLSEGRQWFDKILALPQTDHAETIRARALIAAGCLAFYHQAEYAHAQALYEESLLLSQAADDRATLARVLNELGNVTWWLWGDGAKSRQLLEQSLRINEEVQDVWGQALALSRLGQLAGLEGDIGQARLLIEQSLSLYDKQGDSWGIAYALWSLGDVACKSFDYELARASYERCLPIARAHADKTIVAFSLADLADIAVAQGDDTRAEPFAHEALALFREMGEPWQPPRLIRLLGHITLNQGDITRARTLCLESLALNRALNDQRGLVACLVALACVQLAQSEFVSAAKMFATVNAALEPMRVRLLPNDHRAYELGLAQAQDRAGEAAFEQAWVAGRAMTVDEAVLLALG